MGAHECVDTAFKHNGKKTCAKYLKNKKKRKKLCKEWDNYGRLVQNHCPKTCDYCHHKRCADDEDFIIEHDKIEYNCENIPNAVITCTMLTNNPNNPEEKQLVAEHCRKSCGIC